MSDLIERLRNMRAAGLAAKTQSEYTAAGEQFIRHSEEIIEYVRALESERDFLRDDRDAHQRMAIKMLAERDVLNERIENAILTKVRGKVGEMATVCVSHDLVGKRVALVVVE